MSTTVHVTATDESLGVPSAGAVNARDYLTALIRLGQPASAVLTDDPEAADLIIFAESHLDPGKGTPAPARRVLTHPLYQRFAQKTVVHDGSDRPLPLVPGLYPSIPRRWAAPLACVGAPYLARLNPFLDQAGTAPHQHATDGLTPDHAAAEPGLLACFMGSCARKPLRQHLRHLASGPDWESIDFKDTTEQFVGSLRTNDQRAHEQLKRDFVGQTLRARFSLCPAGAGASSYRIFESMQCARAPVIISDRWSPPPGPDWDSFAIRIPESAITRLPEILVEHRHRWLTMGRLARHAWEHHYCPTVLGNEIVRLGLLARDLAAQHAARRRLAAHLFRVGPAPIQNLRARHNRRAG